MDMFGGKKVVGDTEFVEGTIIEFRNGKLVARDYFEREDGEFDSESSSYELDFVVIAGKNTDYEKTKEIAINNKLIFFLLHLN